MVSKSKILQGLSEFVSFPTVSSNETARQHMNNCASWLQQHFISIGIKQATIFFTSSFPVVYAQYIADPTYKTILFYGHYDVQPATPESEWGTPPFKMVLNGDYIYGRGVSDDKGQLFIHIKAVETILKQTGTLPVNVKFLIEGAEEIGSPGLKDFIMVNKEMLGCDAVVVSDTKMVSANVPAITYSLRGSLNAEIILQTASKELHSGTFGGAVPNAAIIAGELIKNFHTLSMVVAVPGFYDDVENVSKQERQFMKANGQTDNTLLADAGVENGWGDKKYSLQERTTIRPSLAIVSVSSGFTGKGVKNIIPNTATIKINCRLVPRQRPEKIKALFDSFIDENLPRDIQYKIIYSSPANPVNVSVDNPFIQAAANAYRTVFKQQPKLARSGGTIAAVDYLYSILKVPVVLMGFALASDNKHAPNEKMWLPNFFRGIDTSIRFIKNVSAISF